jgi:hypothetical protein
MCTVLDVLLTKKQRNYVTVEKEQQNAAVAADVGETAQ